MAIDFREFQRGQAEGRKALDEAQRFKANESTYALQELNNIYATQDLNIGRQAAAYLAPLATHRQRAAQQGVDPVDFIVSQQQAMLADPNYNRFSPDVQEAINEKFQQQVAMTAETLIKNKDFTGLQKLVETMGIVSPVGAADQASMTADIGGLVTALASQGVPATITADGMVEVNGMKIEPVKFNSFYSQANGNMAMALSMYQQAEEAKTLTDQATNITRAGVAIGTTLGPDGNYYNPVTGKVAIDKGLAELIGLPTGGGTYVPGADTPVVGAETGGAPQGVETVVDMQTTQPQTTSTTPTGENPVPALQQRVRTEGTDTMTVEELTSVANAPKPTYQTVYTPEEQVKLADNRTPPAEKLALQQKMVLAQKNHVEEVRLARAAIDAAKPVAPRIEDAFPDPADQKRMRNYITALSSGVGAQIETALRSETPEFQARFAAFQAAQQAYQQALKGAK